ncbi:MAG: hypothetical protein HKN15_12730 [Xanthomonadales bacterium]|nr:hypothetical protein [Xanthomonadales bacterium]
MRVFLAVLGLVASFSAQALTSAEYLPENSALDPAIPTPESMLGWDVGDWRASHDQIVYYMQALAASSDRVSVKTIGRTHEQRPLLQLIFTSPENHRNLESLRQAHIASATNTLDDDAPLVLWLGHSIHGNEESGANGALLSAYYLAASNSSFVTQLLDSTIILFDPAFNPDGLNRFSSWSNSNRSMNPVGDRHHRINNEAWPGGRTNHYLFDLNRDWLPLVHPESRARVAQFQEWLPHVLTDQHERSRDGYFFQPGVPSRQNPLTPPENFEMTAALAQYHAAAMDAVGEPYFTEDDYDDFYFGKGSTYPDINGGIGILFEQPSIKGPVLDRDSGRMSFVDAIQNQLRTTLSTLKGSFELRDRLKGHQNRFFKTMAKRAQDIGFAAWVIGDDGDSARAAALAEMLAIHDIKHYVLAEDVRAGGQQFEAGSAWVIPTRQRQFGLLQAMMDVRTEFEDNTFYDVSAWTQPLAYNLPYAQLSRMPSTREVTTRQRAAPERAAVAWIVPWYQLNAPALLQKLLNAGALVKAATKPFTALGKNGQAIFDRGDIVVHAGLQQDEGLAESAYRILLDAAQDGIQVSSVSTSLTPRGPDLGALHFERVKNIKPLMIVGGGVSSYDAGEAWHHFDQRLGVVPVMVEPYRLDRIRLADYSHLIIVDGDYSGIGESFGQRLVAWVQEGGTIVSVARGAAWAESLCFASEPQECASESAAPETKPAESRPYSDHPDDAAKRVIGGAIVAARADLSHPIAYGYQRQDLPLFRRGTTLLKASENAYSTPVRYADSPLLAGFIGDSRQDEMRGQAAVIAERKGAGLVVRFANNPLFRGFWRGTERLFENALYMGQLIDDTQQSD